MTESKKAWVTPELIVLVRSKPEERVLIGCKGFGLTGYLPSYNVCEASTTQACYACTGSGIS